jgi:uncharacterized protein (DUF1778 family)
MREMGPAKRGRSERLEARISEAQQELSQEAALEIVRTHDAARPSDRDREAFVSALLTPPTPLRALQRAAKRYRKRMGS